MEKADETTDASGHDNKDCDDELMKKIPSLIRERIYLFKGVLK
jgi:hypothetical protein